MFSQFHNSCITDYSHGCIAHIRSFMDFSPIFHSYLCCDKSTCQKCFVLLFILDLVSVSWWFFFCCFTSSVLPDSCQGVQLLSSSKFHVSSKSVIQSKQIADLTNLGPPPVLPLWTTGNINLSEHLLF